MLVGVYWQTNHLGTNVVFDQSDNLRMTDWLNETLYAYASKRCCKFIVIAIVAGTVFNGVSYLA